MASDLLRDYGVDDDIAAAASLRTGVLGRVIRVDRGISTVVTEVGIRRAAVGAALRSAATMEERPTIGDWVMIDRRDDGDVIDSILPRRSAFRRGDAERMRAQVVAANIDVVFVVHAASAEPNLRRIERELALAWESGATPVIVLTKADLCSDHAQAVAALAPSAPGVEVLVTSVPDALGIDALAAYARPNRTVAFIGASGVGKSTLVNALLGDDVQETAAIREADGRGRHTTSHRELFVLPAGGIVIDTPGLRAIGMWQSDDGIARAFPDIEECAGRCRFSDCAHDVEPGCAVREAVAAGELAPERLRNYRDMLRELDALDTEAEQRSRLEKKRSAKILSRAVRAMPKKG